MANPGRKKEFFDLELNEPGGPATAAPASDAMIPGLADSAGLGFQGEGKPEASFQDTFLRGANIGKGPKQVSFEEIQQKGGIAGIMGEERIDSPVVRPINEVLSALLGETTGTQRARPEPQEMAPWQKGLLFMSDVVAAFDGKVMPSQQLDMQRFRGYSLEDQQNQERFLKGIEATNKFNEMIGRLPLEARMRAAIQQAPQMRKIFGEGFGANMISLASEPSKQEAWEDFAKNAELMEGGAADGVMKYMTYLIGAGETEEAQRVYSVHGLGTPGSPGAFEMDVLYHAPAMLEEKLDGFMGELRKLGGANAALANDIATGAKISPSELVNANADIPENSEFKLDKAVIRTLRVDPGRLGAVIPGMVNAEQQAEEQVAMNNAERSAPMTFIGGKESDNPGHMVTVPALSRKANQLMQEGYHPLDGQLDMLGGLGGGMSDSNMIRLGADFIKESGSFDKLNAAFHVLDAALKHANPVGNMASIFKFMKILDEISVVREGEQKSAAAARARLDSLKTWVKRNITGETLTDTQRQQFLEVATDVWAEAAHEQARREQRWHKRLGSAAGDGLKIPIERHGAIIVDLIGPDRDRFKTKGVPTEDEFAAKREELGAGATLADVKKSFIEEGYEFPQ